MLRRPPILHDLAVARRVPRSTALLPLVGAAILLGWTVGLLGDVAARFGTFGYGTIVYKRAQVASTTALAALAMTMFAFAIWLIAISLRAALGLPGRRPSGARAKLTWVRVIVAFVIMITLGSWAEDEFFARGLHDAPTRALGMGLVLTLMFAYDVPRLVRNAVACLRARAPMRRARRVELAALEGARAGERVRVAGRALAEAALVYEHAEPPRAASFVLESGHHRVFVDVDPGRLIVQSDGTHIDSGASVEVVGEVTTPASKDAYRGGIARLGGSIYLFAGAHAMGRRLVTAACVELFAAVGLTAAVVAPVAFYLYLARFA
jgi:hypothetical protein